MHPLVFGRFGGGLVILPCESVLEWVSLRYHEETLFATLKLFDILEKVIVCNLRLNLFGGENQSYIWHGNSEHSTRKATWVCSSS